MISRRGILGGLLAGLAAPVIIRTPGLLMPIKPLRSGSGILVRDYLTSNSWWHSGLLVSTAPEAQTLFAPGIDGAPRKLIVPPGLFRTAIAIFEGGA